MRAPAAQCASRNMTERSDTPLRSDEGVAGYGLAAASCSRVARRRSSVARLSRIQGLAKSRLSMMRLARDSGALVIWPVVLTGQRIVRAEHQRYLEKHGRASCAVTIR